MIPAAEDFLVARARQAGHIRRPPCRRSPALSDRLGVPVWLKCEHRQDTGAFKLRGATNAVLRLAPGWWPRTAISPSWAPCWPEPPRNRPGTAPGRPSDEASTLADLTGTGVQDTAIATLALARAGTAGTVIST